MAKARSMHGDPTEGPLNVRISKDESAKLAESRPAIPHGIKRIIPLCQISKIFHPYASLDRYMEDPESIENHEDFSVMVQGSWCTKSYRFGEPALISDLEALSLVGIDNSRFEPSTGWTGIVYFEVPEDLLSAYTYLQKTGKAIDPEIDQKLKEHLDRAKELSRRRVIDYMKLRYNDAIAARRMLTEAGGRAGTPEDMEILMTFILRDEIRRAKDKRAKLRSEWEEANKEILGTL